MTLALNQRIDKIALKTKCQHSVEGLSQIYTSPKVTNIDKIGNIDCQGAKISGRVFRIRTTTRVYCFNLGDLSLVVTQACPDDEYKLVQPGFELINSSLCKAQRKPKESGESTEIRPQQAKNVRSQ